VSSSVKSRRKAYSHRSGRGCPLGRIVADSDVNLVLLLPDSNRRVRRLRLHVQVADVQRVFFDELAAGFDVVAHEDSEDFIGACGVF